MLASHTNAKGMPCKSHNEDPARLDEIQGMHDKEEVQYLMTRDENMLNSLSFCFVAPNNWEQDYMKIQEQERAREEGSISNLLLWSGHISEIKAASDSGDPPIFRLADLMIQAEAGASGC